MLKCNTLVLRAARDDGRRHGDRCDSETVQDASTPLNQRQSALVAASVPTEHTSDASGCVCVCVPVCEPACAGARSVPASARAARRRCCKCNWPSSTLPPPASSADKARTHPCWPTLWQQSSDGGRVVVLCWRERLTSGRTSRTLPRPRRCAVYPYNPAQSKRVLQAVCIMVHRKTLNKACGAGVGASGRRPGVQVGLRVCSRAQNHETCGGRVRGFPDTETMGR